MVSGFYAAEEADLLHFARVLVTRSDKMAQQRAVGAAPGRMWHLPQTFWPKLERARYMYEIRECG